MENRRGCPHDRRRARRPRTNRRVPARLGPDPAPGTVPRPISWIPTVVASQITRGAGSHRLFGPILRVIEGGASTLTEAPPLLQRPLRLVEPPVTDDAAHPLTVLLMCRSLASPEHTHSSFEGGFPVIEGPFTPGQLTRRVAEVLAASRSGDCPEQQ